MSGGEFFERVNVLGAPDTAISSDEDRGYCAAISDCLPIVEEADRRIEVLRHALEAILALDTQPVHTDYDQYGNYVWSDAVFADSAFSVARAALLATRTGSAS